MVLVSACGMANGKKIERMIPKIIHYCWFGNGPFPKKVQECLDSWHRYLPDYTIKEWNENNFDISQSCRFVKEAYEQKKYAFVSDYVRLYALLREGGIYMDVDVEVLRPFDVSLFKQPLNFSLEEGGLIAGEFIASEQGHPFLKGMLEVYHRMHFMLEDGSLNMAVNNTYLQEELAKIGYEKNPRKQLLPSWGIELWPCDYFQCRSLVTGKVALTDNSYCIHWHTILWSSWQTKMFNFLRIKVLVPMMGTRNYGKLQKLFGRV